MKSCLHQRPRLRAGLLAILSVFPVAGFAAVAGQFQFVAGDVRVQGVDGHQRPAQKGQEINEGETVVSAAGGSAQLRMIDGGILALRPESQLKISEYRFKGREDGSEKASMSLVKGGLRAISGLIGKTNKQNYAITTPTATIGIRGTDHEPVVVLPPPPGTQLPHQPGTYDKVNTGIVALFKGAGLVLVNPNQVGFAGFGSAPPVILPATPSFYRVTPLPTAMRTQQPSSSNGSGNESGNNNSNNTTSNGNNSSSNSNNESSNSNTSNSAGGTGGTDSNNLGTTTTASGDGTGNALRVNTQADIGSNLPSVNNTASSINPTSPTGTVTNSVLTGSDSSGNKIDATNQVLAGSVTSSYSNTHTEISAPWINAGTLTLLRYLLTDVGNAKDANGNVVQANYVARYGTFDTARFSLSVDGAVARDTGRDAATGLSWGRWDGGQGKMSSQSWGMDKAGNWGYGAYLNDSFVLGGTESESTAVPAGGIHWISGTKSFPDYLPSVLTGTVNYSMVGGTRPTDTNGMTGSLQSASLSVNFSSKLADAKVGLLFNGNTWDLSGKRMVLNGSSFNSYILPSECSTGLSCGFSASKNGTTVAASGVLGGTLTGPSMNGAALYYQFSEGSTTPPLFGSLSEPTVTAPTTVASTNVAAPIAGVVALAQTDAPANILATPWRATGISTGWYNGSGGFFGSDGGAYTSALVNLASFRGYVDGVPAAADQVKFDGDGRLVEFAGRAALPSESSSLPFDAIARVGTAVNTDAGSTVVGGTKVSWGRWEGGSIDIYGKNGQLIGSLDNTGRSLHYIASDTLTAPLVSLPATGRADYTLAGNTAPTDLNGNKGSLAAASLSANFSQMTVDASIKVNMPAAPSLVAGSPTTLSTTATNIALQANGSFSSSTSPGYPSVTTHTASCSGPACGSGTTQAYINGSFIGSGAGGAGLTYGIVSGNTVSTSTSASSVAPSTFGAAAPLPSPGIAVTGVAVFKKN